MKKSLLLSTLFVFFLAACGNQMQTTPTATALVATETVTVVPTSEATAAPAATELPSATPTVIASVNQTQSPITLPAGFSIGVYASGLKGPRMMALGPDGLPYVAERGANRVVRLVDSNQDGTVEDIQVVATGFNKPDSLAFYSDGSLYVSEPTRVWRLNEPDEKGVYQTKQIVIDGLPSGGHATRTLLFSPDYSKLFVSVGSSCNICQEADSRRATIMQFNPDGSNGQIYASGLRNAVGLAYRPGTEELWVTNNGRDNLGDTLPPETVYKVEAGANYGWPVCHAGTIIDPDFGSSNSCQGIGAPVIELHAHMAPLGLAFYEENQFPKEYQGSLFIALHGSWNSSVPVGYKIMWVPIDESGTPGQPQDFATGFLSGSGSVWARPVGLLVLPDGSLLISDDKGGTIFRIYYSGM